MNRSYGKVEYFQIAKLNYWIALNYESVHVSIGWITNWVSFLCKSQCMIFLIPTLFFQGRTESWNTFPVWLWGSSLPLSHRPILSRLLKYASSAPCDPYSTTYFWMNSLVRRRSLCTYEHDDGFWNEKDHYGELEARQEKITLVTLFFWKKLFVDS